MKHENRLQFHTILVATDLTESGSTTLRYAQALALVYKSLLVVVHVIDPVSYAFPSGAPRAATADQTARDELKKIEEETSRQGIPIHSVVEAGVVYERILQAALDHHADLMVLGTRAKTSIGRAALGTVARRLLAKASCPVLAIPPNSEAHLPWAGKWRRVLVATDFSAASILALSHAHRITNQQLTVLHASHEQKEPNSRKYLESLRFLAPFNESHTVPTEHLVIPGDPGSVIAERACKLDADLVVLGSPISELSEEDFQTSTVLQVVSKVNCPVLCVPSLNASASPAVMKEVAFSC